MKNKKEIVQELFQLSVTGYTQFEDRKADLIMQMFDKSPFLSQIRWDEGHKANTKVSLPVVDMTSVWSTDDCPGTTGSVSLSPMEIEVIRISDRLSLCMDKLDGYLPALNSAGARNEDTPIAESLLELKSNQNASDLGKLAFQGNKSTGSGKLALYDGYIAQAEGASASELAGSGTFSTFDSTNAYSLVKTYVDEWRSEVPNSSDYTDVEVRLSPDYFDILSDSILATFSGNALSGTGFYQNAGDINQSGNNIFTLPGRSGIKVISEPAMDGVEGVWITNLANYRAVTDLLSDQETITINWIPEKRTHILDLIYAFGTGLERLGNVVWYKKA